MIESIQGARYTAMFHALKRAHRGAFIPFLVVGDPDLETSYQAIRALVMAGADALELGIPFSDPVADGPVIQAAAVRALKKGVTPDDCFAVIGRIRREFQEVPIGILTYCNAVVANGVDAFFSRVRDGGIDSVLTADLPVAESSEIVASAAAHDVAPVFIAPPNAEEAMLSRIAVLGRGYTYVVTRKGVTGCDSHVDTAFSTVAATLRRFDAPPPVVGFGISCPEHVRAVIRAGAAGAISGSATVALLHKAHTESSDFVGLLTAFTGRMKAATKDAEFEFKGV